MLRIDLDSLYMSNYSLYNRGNQRKQKVKELWADIGQRREAENVSRRDGINIRTLASPVLFCAGLWSVPLARALHIRHGLAKLAKKWRNFRLKKGMGLGTRITLRTQGVQIRIYA